VFGLGFFGGCLGRRFGLLLGLSLLLLFLPLFRLLLL
jgi:hypothetical protein